MFAEIKTHWQNQPYSRLILVLSLAVLGLALIDFGRDLDVKRCIERDWMVIFLLLSLMLPLGLYQLPSLLVVLFALYFKFGIPPNFDEFQHLTFDEGEMLFSLAVVVIMLLAPSLRRRPA